MISQDFSIIVENISKRFKLRGVSGTRTLKSAALDMVRGRKKAVHDFWALKDVSFKVRPGETLGIIGSNGAGKSTLLGLLTRTTEPTAGRIFTQGTISSLLELGAGFHPDLTGRENVFLYGATMGISQRRMKARFDAVVDFAGIGKFIDEPVKYYSSGMYVRLGFAAAVEVDPDILLIDEVLSVGDQKFQRKCIEKINNFKSNGKTMLIISHDMGMIRRVSDRILFLDKGRILDIGDPHAVTDDYTAKSKAAMMHSLKKEWGDRRVELTDVAFFDGQGRKTDAFSFGDRLQARISYHAKEKIKRPVFGFAVSDTAGNVLYGSNTMLAGLQIDRIYGRGVVTMEIGRFNLPKDIYGFSFSVHSENHEENYHRCDNQFQIQVVNSPRPFEGKAFLPETWHSHELGF